MSEKKDFFPGVIHRGDDGVYLVAGRCKACGDKSFPRTEFCYKCGCTEVEEIPLPTQGEIVSHSTAYMPVSKFKVPHTVGYIQLAEDVRILSPLQVEDPKTLNIGGTVYLKVDEYWKDSEGNSVEGFWFLPAQDA